MTEIKGLKEMDRKYKALPAAVAKHVKAAMEKGADEIVALAKRLCPVDSGDLRDSIGWTWGDAPSGSIAIAQSASFNNARITIYAGDGETYYAAWVEFGTKVQEASPFFFPAYRFLKKRVRGRIGRAVTKGFKEALG